MAAVREVAHAVEGLVTICNESCTDEHLLRELSQAASEVTRTLNDLLNHIKYVMLVLHIIRCFYELKNRMP